MTIVINEVRFTSRGDMLAGQLHFPDSGTDSAPLPGIVITGAWTTVKEQMPSVYAREMAARGYAALVFDFRGWGESDGMPRFLEHPARKTEDIIAAAKFLASLDEIDANRIGGLGICASSGYMMKAFTECSDIKTVAAIAAWLHNPAIVHDVYGGDDSIAQLIEAGRTAQSTFDATGESTTLVAASTSDNTSLMYQAPYYTETDRGLIDSYDNKFNVASWEPWLTFDAVELAGRLPSPVTIVHSEAAAIPQGVKQFAEISGDKANVLWLDNVTQFEFYDQPAPVKAASDEVTSHYQRYL